MQVGKDVARKNYLLRAVAQSNSMLMKEWELKQTLQ